MDKIIKIINKSALVGCGGGGGGSNNPVPPPPPLTSSDSYLKVHQNSIKKRDITFLFSNTNENTTYSISIAPKIGSASLTNSSLTYTPNTGATGSDTFTIRSTNTNSFAESTISIDILGRAEFDNQKGLELHNAESAYIEDLSGENIIIGVTDSGLDQNHNDFQDRILTDKGIDFGGEDFNVSSTEEHGTHVGGIIAANFDGSSITNNMHGYVYSSKLIDFRVFKNDGDWSPSYQDLLEDIPNQLVASNALISNNSWGFIDQFVNNTKAWWDALLSDLEFNTHYNRSIYQSYITVFSAGNDGYSESGVLCGIPLMYPELASNWINVVSCDKDGQEAYYTNRAGGIYLWSITAHGGDAYTDEGVLSLNSTTTNQYYREQGTSMAAPSVSGGLALIMSKFLNNSDYSSSTSKPMTIQLCVNRLFQTATYSGLKAGVINSSDILEKNKIDDPFTVYKNASELTNDQKQKIFGYGLMNIQAAIQDMNQTEYNALVTFKNTRETEIQSKSANFKLTTSNAVIEKIVLKPILY